MNPMMQPLESRRLLSGGVLTVASPISLSNGNKHIVLTIQNDGKPFPDLKGHPTGMGVRIMNYRASVIGGALEIKGTGQRGTRVTCSVPLAKARQDSEMTAG